MEWGWWGGWVSLGQDSVQGLRERAQFGKKVKKNGEHGIQVWHLSSKSSSASVPVPEGHLAQGRASYVWGHLERVLPPPLPLPQGSVEGSRLLSHRWLPVSRVHQLGSQAEFLEALVAHHNDNGGGRG